MSLQNTNHFSNQDKTISASKIIKESLNELDLLQAYGQSIFKVASAKKNQSDKKVVIPKKIDTSIIRLSK